MMEHEIEEQKIELNPELKQRGLFEFTSLDSYLISDEDYENAKALSMEKKIYHCSSKLDEAIYVSGLRGHPILEGYYQSYAKHIPVTVSPDILWMLIVQGFSRHIDQNAEKLRNKFVDFDGQKALILGGDEWTIEEITREGWESTFAAFVELIKRNAGDSMIKIITPTFSTTTPTIQVSSQIAIMSCFKNYFKYIRLYGGCGFPYINLQGTLKDYEELKSKVEKLKGFDIDDWIMELIIIIDKIIETKKGKVDVDFWKNMIKNKETIEPRGSGALTKVENIDGWLLNFYPYYKVDDVFKKCEKLVRKTDFNKPLDVKNLENIPEEMVEVPLIMHHKITGKDTELTIKTGFLGMIQEKNGLAKPEIGWFITNKIDIGEARQKIRELEIERARKRYNNYK
jgi:hypothetical protein